MKWSDFHNWKKRGLEDISFPFVELMKYNPSAGCYRRCSNILPVSAEMHVQMLCLVYFLAATMALKMLIIECLLLKGRG